MDWKFVVIYINLSTLITCKNYLSIINIRSNNPSVLYFCKIIFKGYYTKYNVLITEKSFVRILKKQESHLKKHRT